METINDKIEELNNFFKQIKERDNKLLNDFIYGRLDIYNRH